MYGMSQLSYIESRRTSKDIYIKYIYNQIHKETILSSSRWRACMMSKSSFASFNILSFGFSSLYSSMYHLASSLFIILGKGTWSARDTWFFKGYSKSWTKYSKRSFVKKLASLSMPSPSVPRIAALYKLNNPLASSLMFELNPPLSSLNLRNSSDFVTVRIYI